MLEFIYGENEDLAKIHALGVLVNFYAINSNLTLSKFKALAVTNSWRINIKICELTPLLLEKISKAHFKLVFQPLLLKFLVST